MTLDTTSNFINGKLVIKTKLTNLKAKGYTKISVIYFVIFIVLTNELLLMQLILLIKCIL